MPNSTVVSTRSATLASELFDVGGASDAPSLPDAEATARTEAIVGRDDDRRNAHQTGAYRTASVTDADLAAFEAALPNVVRLRRVALSATTRGDWTNVGGQPYLGTAGCMKIAAIFGVSLTGTRVKAVRDDAGGSDVIRYVARTTARFLGRRVEVEGVASSSESFFSRRRGKRLPLSEIDLSAVRKKAVTNAQIRAVKCILGLGGITWEEVRAAGVTKDGVAAVDFGRRGEQETPSARPPAGAVTKRQPRRLDPARRRLYNILLELGTHQQVRFDESLRHYSRRRGADGNSQYAERINDLDDAWLQETLERAEHDWREIPVGQLASRIKLEQGD